MDHRAAKVGSSEDRILEEITLAVCAVAAVSGGLGPAMVEEELAKIAIGRLTGCLYEQSDQVKL
ncbi:MAG TPA: hypothetical protein VNX67_04020, partial [Solirubrobacteraceae bacterium]|nr:hypothetical protein [Solirubrobacteraceae bacterium]